jgi:ribosome-dependent ATPase
MINFLLLVGLAVFLFHVPLKGSFLTLSGAALLYVMSATGFGLLISAFMRSQVAALVATIFLSILPAVQLSGMVEPVSSLQGVGAFIGRIFPTTHFLTISRGTFSKGLGFTNLHGAFVSLALSAPVIIGLGVVLLKKQER